MYVVGTHALLQTTNGIRDSEKDIAAVIVRNRKIQILSIITSINRARLVRRQDLTPKIKELANAALQWNVYIQILKGHSKSQSCFWCVLVMWNFRFQHSRRNEMSRLCCFRSYGDGKTDECKHAAKCNVTYFSQLSDFRGFSHFSYNWTL